jgi:hypothetical protein
LKNIVARMFAKYFSVMAFPGKLLGMVDKGMAASRAAVSKAGAQAQTWGEMGVLKVEIVQLRAQAERLTAQLGAAVYAAFSERKETSLSVDSPALAGLVGRISELASVIAAKEAAFLKLGGKRNDFDDENER